MAPYAPLEAAIIHFVHRLPGNLTRTKLVKLLYLLDLAHTKQYGESATGVTYRSYYYGPYSPQILDAIRKLDGYEIQEGSGLSFHGRDFYTYSPGHNPRRQMLPRLDPKVQGTLNQVIEQFGRFPLENLLNAVYATQPFKRTTKGSVIRLSR